MNWIINLNNNLLGRGIRENLLDKYINVLGYMNKIQNRVKQKLGREDISVRTQFTKSIFRN